MSLRNILGCGIGALAIVISSCSHSNGWKINGTLNNAPANSKIAVDGFNGLYWHNIDSLTVDANGKFAYQSESAVANPDVYRVVYDGKSIYFPIDSIETITITADASDFGRNYTLDGSATAKTMMEIDQKIAEKGLAVLADSTFKREIANVILSDTVGSLSYYLINKTIGEQPLFNDANRQDVRIIGAVANIFNTHRPNDPRTKPLSQRLLNARRNLGMTSAVAVEAEVTGLIDIVLPDNTGKEQSLKEVADNAGVTLLSFTAYDLENSPEYNQILAQLYKKYSSKNIAIYQVSLDNDEVFWMQAAANLPWVTVRYNNQPGAITSYYVEALPTTFVIDGKGDIRERVINPADLDAAIARLR